MSLSRRAGRLRPTWPRTGVLATFGIALLTLAWPTLNGRSSSVVPSFQTATFPWAAEPRGLRFLWPQSDQAESAYPWAVLARRSWRSGDLPLWDPHSFGGGVPWATDGVAATLYPVRAALDALFLPWIAHDLFVLLHLALAGAGAFWLARRWGAGLLGATVAGVGWMTNAYVWSWAPLEMVTPFFAALPLMLASADRALRSPGRRNVVSAAAIFALGMVSGNLAYSVILAAAVGIYVAGVVVARLVRSRRLRDRELGRTTASGAGLLLLGLALSAVVLVPTLLNLALISRQPFTFEVLRTSLLVPWDAYGRLVQTPETPPTAVQLAVQLYVTPVALLLAALGLLLARGSGAWSARLVVAVPVAIASTVPGAWVAYHFFPGFDAIRPYGRILPIALLGVYVLAGLGADRAWQLATSRVTAPRWLASVVAAAVVASVFVPALVVSRTLVPPPLPVADYPQFPRTPLIREIKTSPTTTGWPARILPGTSAFDTEPPTFGAAAMVGGTATVPGIDTWGGYASAVPEQTSDLLRIIAGEPDEVVLGDAPGPDITHPIYATSAVDWAVACRMGSDLLAMPPAPAPEVSEDWGSIDPDRQLREVYAGPDGRVFRMPKSCAAGPYLSSDVVVRDAGAPTIEALRSQGDTALAAPRTATSREVVVDDRATGTVTPGASGEVLAVDRDGSSSRIDVSTDGAMWLVLPLAADEGWSVSIDGQQAATEEVDFNRVGVVVPAGESEVEIAYSPPGLALGLTATLLGLVAAAISWVGLPRRARVDPDVPPVTGGAT